MKKIIITGGQGFFGSRFKEMWKDQYDIIALGSRDLDVTDEAKVSAYIEKEKPDYVIHAAGLAVQQYCIDHPDEAYDVNVNGSVYIAKATAKVGAKLIFLSTEQIFNGSEEKGPYTEESTPCPNTVYGENKWEVEQRLPEIIKECWILRFTWLFGLPQRNCKLANSIMWDTIEAVLKNKEIKTSEYEFRGMTDVSEICENLEKVFSIPYGTYNFGSRNDMGRYDVVKHILTLLGVDQEYIDTKLIADNSKYTRDNIRELRLDNTKITNAGIKFTPTKESMEKCLKEFQMI